MYVLCMHVLLLYVFPMISFCLTTPQNFDVIVNLKFELEVELHSELLELKAWTMSWIALKTTFTINYSKITK